MKGKLVFFHAINDRILARPRQARDDDQQGFRFWIDEFAWQIMLLNEKGFHKKEVWGI
jgi:hypothetical protein